MGAEFFLHLMMAFGAAAGVYAAIKADLTRAIVIAEQASKSAECAHTRLSEHVDHHHTLKGNL